MSSPEKKETIFRQESLERLSSPERLDELMRVVSPVDWLILLTFSGMITASLIWSIVGRIPITVQGKAILIQPRQVAEFQANIGGQIESLNMAAGECIKKDQVLATVNPLDLRQQLQIAQQKLVQLQNQTQQTLTLSKQRLATEANAIIASRVSLEKRLQDTLALTPILRSSGLDALEKQQASLQQRLDNAKSLVPILEKRLTERQLLFEQGGVSRDSILQVEQEYIKAQESVADIEAQLEALEIKSTETEREYLQNLSTVEDIKAQLQELDAKQSRLDQENLDTNTQREKEIQDVTREITRLEQQISNNSKIISTQTGCILELNTTLGQVVQPGTKLGYLQIKGKNNQEMKALSYLPVKDGKQVVPGMKIVITPDTVQRERFGGIVGEVVGVSSLPITKEGAAASIGNIDLAQNLLASGEPVMEIKSNLIRDFNNVSGYKWSSSKGTSTPITSGTTATVRIIVEERAPITFILPFLQDFEILK